MTMAYQLQQLLYYVGYTMYAIDLDLNYGIHTPIKNLQIILWSALKALCHDIRAIFSKLNCHVMYHAYLIEKRPSLFNQRP